MFSEPAVGEKFFGRGEALEIFGKRVRALKDGYRQNIALTGQSLVGKTSLILHFLYMVREEGFIPVYVEVVKEPFRNFAGKFIATMIYNVLTRMGESPAVAMDALIERARSVMPKTAAAIRQVNSKIEEGGLDEAYLMLLGLTSTLKEETGLSSIVILDEFDNLEKLGIRNPFLTFGKVIMVQKDTMYVVSSSRNRAIQKIISEKLSLLFGNFEVIKVSNFNTATAGELIGMRLAGFDIDPALKRFLIDFSGGNPFYLDRLARSIRQKALEKMMSFIDADIVTDSIRDLVYDANGVIHQYLMNFVLSILDSKNRDHMISVMTAISKTKNTCSAIARSLKARQADMSRDLAWLLEAGILSKNGVFYRLDDRMLAYWLGSVYQRRKELLVDGTVDKAEIFRRDIKSHIEAFIADDAREPAERVAAIFSSFSNELVQIDDKLMRMPHFTRVETKSFAPRNYIVSAFRTNIWMVRVCKEKAVESDVVSFVRDMKATGDKMACRIIVSLKGIDENARLLAKELKISVWDIDTVNALGECYGKTKIVAL